MASSFITFHRSRNFRYALDFDKCTLGQGRNTNTRPRGQHWHLFPKVLEHTTTITIQIVVR